MMVKGAEYRFWHSYSFDDTILANTFPLKSVYAHIFMLCETLVKLAVIVVVVMHFAASITT